MLRSYKFSLSFAASLLLLFSLSEALAQLSTLPIAKNRIAVISDADVVTLTGNTHPLAQPEFDLGLLAADSRLERMVLVLQPGQAQQHKLDALTESQQNPESPLFHEWLSPEEYGTHFGASSRDAAKIAAWLQSHGFEVEAMPAGRSSIVFSGTAGQVEETFHTQMHRYQIGGALHIANAQDPQIPKALAPLVAGILSLHDFRRNSQAHRVSTIAAANPLLSRSEASSPDNTEGNAHYLFPADFATIYDLNPLYAAGNNGNGISIAIVGRSNINLSDVSSFRSYAGLAVNAPTVILDGPNPGLIAGDQDEATLDVEWAGGVAPNAKIKYVAAKSTSTSDGVDLAAQYIVNNKTALIMSTSFGNCEAHMGAAEVAFYNSLWQQAAVEGISAFVSSGDSGASGCDAGSASSGSGAAVNGLCSSPYLTCVGGTEFNEGSSSGKYWGSSNGAGGGSALAYIREEVWNESGSDSGNGLWSSGGGISQIYTQPSWQKSIPGANSNGMRAVPDVALNAASHDGYLVALNGSWYDFSGTSASSPSFAGIMALLLQKQSGAGQGNANPALYAMSSSSVNPFHSTPSGNNSVPRVGGFSASGTAYNLATGLGSVDADLLVSNWQSAAKATQPSFTIKGSTGSVSLISGKAASFTVTVTAAGGFSGQVSLTASKLPTGVVVTFNPAVVKPGASSTVTVTATNSAVASVGSILLTGTSGSLEATAAINLTVQMPATLTVSTVAGTAAGTAASKLTIVQGKTTSLLVTANTGGIYTGTVTLSVAGLPLGVTASWSSNSFKATGSGSFSSTLTLIATSSATLTSATLSITAAGDGLKAQTASSLQITAAPAINLALSSSAISMQFNGSGQIIVTANPVGGIKPAASLAGVVFQVAGVPAGVTISWSKPSRTSTGALEATLTLTGSKKAVASTNKLTIKVAVTDSVSKASYTASLVATVSVTVGK